MPVVSLVHWQCTGNLLSSGSSQRISIEQTCEGLEIDGKVGAKCTLHTLGAMTPELYYDEAYENAVCSLKEIAAAAEKPAWLWLLNLCGTDICLVLLR